MTAIFWIAISVVMPTSQTPSPVASANFEPRVHAAPSRPTMHGSAPSAGANLPLPAEDLRESTLLTDVEVTAGPGGSFVVQRIVPNSLYARLGLRPGDVVHDLEALADLEFPRALEHAARNSEFRLAVYRDGSLTVLTTTAGE